MGENEKFWLLIVLVFSASGLGAWVVASPFKNDWGFIKRSRLRQMTFILLLVACVTTGIILGIGYLSG
jgi:hypothetical protein